MASCHIEFIAARDRTPTWADFEVAKAEWEVEAIAAQEEQKREKSLKKREKRCHKKEAAARAVKESWAEIQARWDATDKAEKENEGVWPAWPDYSTYQDRGGSCRDAEKSWVEIQARWAAADKDENEK
jgi:hypothetical protein